MSAPFTFTSPNPLVAQPNGAGEKMIFVSDDAADTMNLSLTGLVAAVSTTNTAALTGKREKETTSTFTSLTIAKLASAAAGTVSVYGQGTAATGDVRLDTANPADGETFTIGLTGFTQAYRFKNTTAAAYDVKIGANATATMLNLKKAINADGLGDGTDYHTGTAANPYVSATAATTVVSLTDRIKVARQLAWSLAQSASSFSIRTMVGGVTGTLLAELTPGTTMAYDSFTLDTPDSLTMTLPAKFTGNSDAIAVNGRPFVLRHSDDGTGNDSVVANYQTSSDGTNWSNGLQAFASNLDFGGVEFVLPDELLADYVRLQITANTNTTDLAVDARAIFG